MIKNKKAISNLLITLIAVVIAFMTFVLVYPNSVGNLTKQIESKASIEKYLPDKINAAKEPVTMEMKIYSFEIIKRLLDDSYMTKKSIKRLNEGQFYLIKRDVLDDNNIIGFVEINGVMRVYSSPDSNNVITEGEAQQIETSSASYFDKTLFDNDIDRQTILSLLENKEFVILSREENKLDEPIFLYHVTGFPIDNNRPDKYKDDTYYSLENILKRNVVKSLSFSTGKKSEIYYQDYEGKQKSKTISEKGEEYILIYRLDNYVVFFPQSGITSTELTNNRPIEIDGNGLTSPDLIDDLIRENMIVKIE